MSQFGILFNIRYPSFYEDLVDTLGSINLSVGLVPFDCVIPFAKTFYFELLTKTAVPLSLVIVLSLTAKSLRRVSTIRKTRKSTPYMKALQHNPDSKSDNNLVADLLDDVWFFIIFLTYPSVCSTIFTAFMAENFDAVGEDSARLLRVDRSIDMRSANYQVFWLYAFLMVFVFPIGVPLLYALMLFRSRHELNELRLIELSQTAEYEATLLRAEGIANIEERLLVEAKAEEEFNTASARYQELRDNLPTVLRKLTQGYELRTYWFEIFECGRKILLAGLPVFFPSGSGSQFIFGLIICFATFGMHCTWAPYIDDGDDLLSSLCQLSIFFSLCASVITNEYPDDATMSALLPVVIVTPAVMAFAFQAGFLDQFISKRGGHSDDHCVDRLIKKSTGKIVIVLDRLLGTKKKASHSEELERRLSQKQARDERISRAFRDNEDGRRSSCSRTSGRRSSAARLSLPHIELDAAPHERPVIRRDKGSGRLILTAPGANKSIGTGRNRWLEVVRTAQSMQSDGATSSTSVTTTASRWRLAAARAVQMGAEDVAAVPPLARQAAEDEDDQDVQIEAKTLAQLQRARVVREELVEAHRKDEERATATIVAAVRRVREAKAAAKDAKETSASMGVLPTTPPPLMPPPPKKIVERLRRAREGQEMEAKKKQAAVERAKAAVEAALQRTRETKAAAEAVVAKLANSEHAQREAAQRDAALILAGGHAGVATPVRRPRVVVASPSHEVPASRPLTGGAAPAMLGSPSPPVVTTPLPSRTLTPLSDFYKSSTPPPRVVSSKPRRNRLSASQAVAARKIVRRTQTTKQFLDDMKKAEATGLDV